MQERFLELAVNNHGRFALMKDRKVVSIFDTFGDAYTAGNLLFEDRVFSAQKITREVLNLGIWSSV